jgi:hypothetical protein
MLIIDDWLEDRIDAHRLQPAPTNDPTEFEMLAGVIGAEAVASGYTYSDLDRACNGDIAAFLMMKLNPDMPAGGADGVHDGQVFHS